MRNASTQGRRAFRFAVSSRGAHTKFEWQSLAREAEAMGFSTLGVPNHLVVPPGVTRFALGPALIAAADATTKLRVASFVFDNDFWHPALLAQEVATIDVLTGGRFEFGLGAGYMRSEYQKAGIVFDTGQTRVERMNEALVVVKALLAGHPLSFSGKYYRIEGLEATCRPVQVPYPPILVGGGRPRLLTVAAVHADIVSIAPRSRTDGVGYEQNEPTHAAFEAKIAILHEAAGARVAQLELNCLVQEVVITDNRRREVDRLASEWHVSADEVLRSPIALIGTVEQIRDQIVAIRSGLGISYITVFEKDMRILGKAMETLIGK